MLLDSLFTKNPVKILSIRSNFHMSLKGKNIFFLYTKIDGFSFRLLGKLLLMLKNFTGLLVGPRKLYIKVTAKN